MGTSNKLSLVCSVRRYIPPPKKFYVYVYFRPWNGQPCYVGKGCDRRWRDHLILGMKHYNKRFARIFGKASRLGLPVPCVVIRTRLSHDEAISTEVALIAVLGRTLLVNATDGGDGVAGLRWSAKAKARQAEVSRGRKQTPESIEKTRQANLGIKRSLESRAKMSAKAKERSSSPEFKARTAALGRRKPSEETKAKIRESLKGREFTPEWKLKLSIAARNRKNKQ